MAKRRQKQTAPKPDPSAKVEETSQKSSVESSGKSLQNEKELAKLREKKIKDQKELDELGKKQEERDKESQENQKKSSVNQNEELKKKRELKKIEEDINDILTDHLSLVATVSENARALLPVELEKLNLAQGMVGVMQRTLKIQEEQGTISDAYVSSMARARNYTADSEDLQDQILKNADKALTGQYESVDLSKQEVALKRAQSFYDQNKASMSEKERENAKQALKLMKESYIQNKLMNESLEQASKSAKRIVDTFDNITQLKFGDAIRSGLDLDGLQNDINKKVKGSLANAIIEIRGSKGLVGGMKAAGAGLGELIKMAPKFAMALGIGGIIAAVSYLFEAFGKVDEEVSQLGRDMGISKSEAMELHHTAVDLAGEMKLVGINANEVAKGVKLASEMMGDLDMASRLAAGDEKAKQLVKDTTILSEKFGLSGEEIKNINDLATMSGKSMGQLTAEASSLNKGLLTSKESLKVLAKVPKEVAVSFKGGTQELIKAAAKAKLLGVELSKVKSIGDGMLDIETSLEKEMEARVLTGKNINLDAARAYALQGDVASLQDELLRQMGSLEDFQKMGPIQQKSMADAMGMTVEEMTNMLTNAEKLKDLGISQEKMTKLQEMNAEQLNAELAKGGKQQYQDYVRNLAKEKESEENKKKLADAMTKLQEKLTPIISKLVDIADKFIGLIDTVGGLEPLLLTIGGIIAFIATVTVGKKLVDSFKMAKDGVSALKDGLGGMFDMIKGQGGEAMDLITDKASEMTDIASDATEKVTEAATEKVEDKVKDLASDKVESIVDDAASEGTDKLVESFTGTADQAKGLEAEASAGGAGGGGNAISNFINSIDPTRILAVAGALVLFAAALYITAKAFQEFGNVNFTGVIVGVGAMVLLVGVAGLLAVFASVIAGSGAVAAMYAVGAAILMFSAALLVSAIAFEMMSKINWDGFNGAFEAIATLAEAFAYVGLLSFPIALGVLAMLGIAVAAGAIGLSLIMIGTGLKAIADAGDLTAAGKNLVNGMMEIAKAPAALLNDDIEDQFDELEDILDELDFSDLKALSELANSDMSKAGKNLVEGINSLAQVGTSTDFGSSGFLGMGKTGIKAVMDDFSSALEEIDFGGIKALAEIANTDMSQVGPKINDALLSLSQIGTDVDLGSSGFFGMAGETGITKALDSLSGAIGQLDYEDIKEFSNVDWSKFSTAGAEISKFFEGISKVGGGNFTFFTQLAQLFNTVMPEQINAFATSIGSLAQSLGNLAGALERLAIEKLDKLNSMIYNAGQVEGSLVLTSDVGTIDTGMFTTVNSNSSGGGGTGGGGGSAIEQKLDTLISVLSQAANQPLVIKFGDKTIEEFKGQLSLKSDAQLADNTYGRSR